MFILWVRFIYIILLYFLIITTISIHLIVPLLLSKAVIFGAFFRALEELDRSDFQGRLLHIMPAKGKNSSDKQEYVESEHFCLLFSIFHCFVTVGFQIPPYFNHPVRINTEL